MTKRNSNTSTDIITLDKVSASLKKVGLNAEEELLALDSVLTGSLIPRVRIEHSDSGRHRMFVDLGESYLGTDNEIPLAKNTLRGVIFAFQDIRALWQEGEVQPVCSAIAGKPVVDNPLNSCCAECPESAIKVGKCKAKVRLYLVTNLNGKLVPVAMTLSPTSIKHWQSHLRKLKRSGLPVIAVQAVFTLDDIKKPPYRWAECVIDVDGLASKEELLEAIKYRKIYAEYLRVITGQDFNDPGDKTPKSDNSSN